MKCRLTDMTFPLCFCNLNFGHRREKEYLKLRCSEHYPTFHHVQQNTRKEYIISQFIFKLLAASLVLKHFFLIDALYFASWNFSLDVKSLEPNTQKASFLEASSRSGSQHVPTFYVVRRFFTIFMRWCRWSLLQPQ
jgi:hypothetical protein